MDKSLLRQAVLARLQADFDLLTRAAHMAREEAIDDESKARDKYETHGREAAYLAESQARLASELRDSLAFYQALPLPGFATGRPAGIGALISLGNRGRSTWYFLGPRNGGLDIEINGVTVTLVTPQSPLGARLVGARTGDTVQLPGRAAPQPHKVTAIL